MNETRTSGWAIQVATPEGKKWVKGNLSRNMLQLIPIYGKKTRHTDYTSKFILTNVIEESWLGREELAKSIARKCTKQFQCLAIALEIKDTTP